MGRKTPGHWTAGHDETKNVKNIIQAKYLIRRSIRCMNDRDMILARMMDGQADRDDVKFVKRMNRRIREIDRDLVALGCKLKMPPEPPKQEVLIGCVIL